MYKVAYDSQSIGKIIVLSRIRFQRRVTAIHALEKRMFFCLHRFSLKFLYQFRVQIYETEKSVGIVAVLMERTLKYYALTQRLDAYCRNVEMRHLKTRQ